MTTPNLYDQTGPPGNCSDEELIRLWQEGNDYIFEVMYQKYAGIILRKHNQQRVTIYYQP